MKLNFWLSIPVSMILSSQLLADDIQSSTQITTESTQQTKTLAFQHRHVIKISLTECPEMKTFDALIKTMPSILLRLRAIAKKAETISENLSSAEFSAVTSINPTLEKQALDDHVDALLIYAKDSFDAVRKHSKLILPIVHRVLNNKPSLFIDFLSESCDATNYFHKTVTSTAVLKELCSDLSLFAKSVSASLSKDTEERIKQLLQTLKK